jgi:hypothetical protein
MNFREWSQPIYLALTQRLSELLAMAIARKGKVGTFAAEVPQKSTVVSADSSSANKEGSHLRLPSLLVRV